MHAGKKLLYNTLLLTGASLFLRAVHVRFQIYLAGVIGASGVGLFSLIASAHMLFITISVSGIRFATTRLVSEELGQGNTKAARRVMGRCIAHALGFGTLACIALSFFASWISTSWISDPQAYLPLRILAISLPFIAMISTLNGYFVAVGRAYKSASISVIEALTRVSVIITALTLFPPENLEAALITLVIGGVFAEILSACILLSLFFHDRRKLSKHGASGENLTRRLLHISMPLAASTYARNALNTLQHMLIPRGLRQHGASPEQSLASYGLVHGLALPIILFPSALFYSLSELIIPELTAAQMKGDQKRISYLVSKLLRLSIYVSVGLSGLFFTFSLALGELIYPATHGVGPYIRILSFIMPIMFLDAITDGMLKGLGQQVYSMGVNIVDSLVSVLLVYLLLPIFGVSGFLFMVYFTEAFNFAFSLGRIGKITVISLSLGDLVRPIVSIAAATQLTTLALRHASLALSPTILSLVLHFFLAGLLYFGFLVLLGCIRQQDFSWAKRLFVSS